jgi:hypothetical protein
MKIIMLQIKTRLDSAEVGGPGYELRSQEMKTLLVLAYVWRYV